MKGRLIVADDHHVVRQGIRDIVEATTDLEVVAEATDGVVAERLARGTRADMLLLDIALPGLRGLQVVESLRGAGIGLPILVFSMFPEAQYAEAARRAGAQGYVGKGAEPQELLQAIRGILAGGTSYPHRHRRRADASGLSDPFAGLSSREIQVMEGLLQGASLVDIAGRLGVGARSITTYRRRLLDKLGVHGNAELAVLAARHGRL